MKLDFINLTGVMIGNGLVRIFSHQNNVLLLFLATMIKNFANFFTKQLEIQFAFSLGIFMKTA